MDTDKNIEMDAQSNQFPKRLISVELLQEVVNYLSRQPFGEVHQMINQLLQLPAGTEK